jgi:uncharacterized protein (DUF488 family)
MPESIFTIGHSTHTIERFLELLQLHGVGCVADVRMHPGSRRLPHFNAAALQEALAPRAVGYAHLPELGGRRRPIPRTQNLGWENDAFRGYADHMESDEFVHGLRALIELGGEEPTAVMCAEALWWRCHRRLISDALLVRGVAVHHIGPDGRLSEHGLTPFAVARGTHLSYPPAQESLNLP